HDEGQELQGDSRGLPLGPEEERRYFRSNARHPEKEREGEKTHQASHRQQGRSRSSGAALRLGKCGKGDRIDQSGELVNGKRGEIIGHGIVSEQCVSEESATNDSIGIGQGKSQSAVYRSGSPEEQVCLHSPEREAWPAEGALD